VAGRMWIRGAVIYRRFMTLWAGRWSDFRSWRGGGKGGYQGSGFYVMKWVWYDPLHMGTVYTGLDGGVLGFLGFAVGERRVYIMILGWKLCFFVI